MTEPVFVVTTVFMNNARQKINFDGAAPAFSVGEQAILIYSSIERKPDIDGNIHLEITHVIGQRTEAS